MLCLCMCVFLYVRECSCRRYTALTEPYWYQARASTNEHALALAFFPSVFISLVRARFHSFFLSEHSLSLLVAKYQLLSPIYLMDKTYKRWLASQFIVRKNLIWFFYVMYFALIYFFIIIIHSVSFFSLPLLALARSIARSLAFTIILSLHVCLCINKYVSSSNLR